MREDARSGAGGKTRLLMGRQVERNLTKKVMAVFWKSRSREQEGKPDCLWGGR